MNLIDDIFHHIDEQLAGVIRRDIEEVAQKLVVLRLRREWTLDRVPRSRYTHAIRELKPSLIKLFTELHEVEARLETRLIHFWHQRVPSMAMIEALRDARLSRLCVKDAQLERFDRARALAGQHKRKAQHS